MGCQLLCFSPHPTTSIQYKFRGISPPSMEIYRGAGIEDDIRAHRTGDQKAGGIARVKNLADSKVVWQEAPWADTRDLSPATAGSMRPGPARADFAIPRRAPRR
jgi:putative polyketide hydroxylase